MRLLRRKQEEKALTGSGGAIDAIQGGWAPMQLLGSGARDRILNIYNVAQGASYGWLYSKSPAVRMVIDKIAKDVAALELRLYEEVSESERQPRPDHPAALSLRYPNESTPADQLIRGLVKDWLIHDNSYALLVPTALQRIWIQRLPAFMIEVQGSNLFRSENYRMWTQGAWTTAGAWGGGGSWKDFAPDQIFHWHGEHPQYLRVGLSKLDTLRGVIAEDAALQQTIVELANAGLQEPTWVFRPAGAPEMTAAAVRAREEDLANRIRARTKKPLVMVDGEEMRSFGITPHDAEMMDLRKWAVAQVASEYDVPPGKVGLELPSQEAEDDYNKDVLWPTCKAFTSMLNHRILVGAYNWLDGCFEFNLDERLMGNDRLKALVSATGRPVMLTNEGRAKLNLPPVDGGDELVTPLNVIVGDNPQPSPQIMPPQDSNKPAQDGGYRQGDGGTPIASGRDGKALELLEAASQADQRLPQYHPRRKADIERQRRHIDAFQGVVQKHFNRLERSLRAKAQTDWTRWDREFADDIDRELKRVVQSEGDIYSMKLAANNFQMGEVQHYLKAMADGAATAINDTIRQEIESLGLDSALNLAPRHVSTAGTSLGARATIWAREESARQSGSADQRVKTWVADTDRHAEFDGDTVGLGEDWPAGFAPGLPANCACTATIS